MELRQHYQDRVSTLAAQLKARKKRNKYFILLEVVSFVAAISAVAAYTTSEGRGLECIVAVAMACFVYGFTRWADGRNSTECDQLEDRLNVNRDELAALDGDYSRFDDGRQYADPRHPYSFDLDIFGAESLFQRINRTSTTGGSDMLARALSRDLSTTDGLLSQSTGDAAVTIDHQAATINQWAAQADWRERMMAAGKRHRIDTAAILGAVELTAQEEYPRWPRLLCTRVAIMLLSVGLALTIVLAIAGYVEASVPLLWGTVQFFLALLLTQKPLRRIGNHLNRLNR